MITITPVPAFEDNYLWVLHNHQYAIVVDPGDANAVTQYLQAHQLQLAGILVTHHHADHTGGVAQLKQRYNCSVWGPKNDPVNHLDYSCGHGDVVEIESLKLQFEVLAVSGHTKGHIAYFLPKSEANANALFCGDTLFSAGCGRLFEGTAEQMWDSMQKITQLPSDTQVFPAHEYTLSNLDFAQKVEPQNQAITEHIQKVKKLRAQGQPSLPSNLALEMSINPFIRVTQPTVIQAAQRRQAEALSSPAEVFAVIRRWKDG